MSQKTVFGGVVRAFITLGISAGLAFSCGRSEAAEISSEDLADWQYSAAIVFSGYVGGDIANFPALIRLSEGVGGFSYAQCRSDGSDVRFSARNGIILPSECVKWDPAGESEFWVRVPLLSPNLAIGVHWGNPSAKKPRSFRDVWADGYIGVWHLDEMGTAVLDSSRQSTMGVANFVGGSPGVAGFSRTFVEANGDYVQLGNEANFRPANDEFSIECWFKLSALPASGSRVLISHSQGWNEGFLIGISSTGTITAKTGNGAQLTAAVAPALDTWHHVLYARAANKSAALYFDGALVSSGTPSMIWPSGSTVSHMMLGHSETLNGTWKESYLDGMIDEYRMSAVVRSADYARAVFQNVLSTALFQEVVAAPPGNLIVTGNEVIPAGVGGFAPECGVVGGYEAGDPIVCNAPEVIEDAENGVRYTCKGYTLHSNGVLLASAENTTSCSTVFSASGEELVLTWLWEKEYRFTISASENGSVTPCGENWFLAGSDVTIESEPTSAAFGFYRWTGDLPETSEYSAAITLRADRARVLEASFGNAWYVNQVGGLDENPGNDPAQAFATLPAAIAAAVDGDAIWIADGSYTNGSMITVNKSLAIRSVNGAEKTIFDGKNSYRVFDLTKDGTYLQGLTVRGAYCNSWNLAGGINVAFAAIQDCIIDSCFGSAANTPAVKIVTSGWISRSIIRNCYSNRNSDGQNSALMTAGKAALIEDCVITNNTQSVPAGNVGAAVYAGAERTVIRNCLIADNHGVNPSSLTLKGGGIYATRWTRIESCTIADNDVDGFGGGIYATAQLALVDTIMDGNIARASIIGAPDDDLYYGADFTGIAYSLSAKPIIENSDGNILANANFADDANGDFQLSAASRARDSGLFLAWHENAADISGNRRIENDCVDIGAFEYLPTGEEPLVCSFSVNIEELENGARATFSALAVGSDLENLVYTWDFGDGATLSGGAYSTVTHDYLTPAYYSVTLTVSNGSAQIATASMAEGVKVLPETCYVAKGGRAIPPYASRENAAENLSDVLMVAKKRIEIGEGVFTPPPGAVVIIDRPLKIVGVSPEKTIFDMRERGGTYFSIVNADAELSGVTIRNGVASWNVAALLELTDGTVTNCVFESSRCANTGAIMFHGGRIVACIVRGISDSSGGSRTGGVLCAGTGIIENTIISNCVCRHPNFAGGAGIFVQKTASVVSPPTIRNCLITGNVAYPSSKTSNSVVGGAGVAFDNPAIIENCTIAKNVGAGEGIGLHLTERAATSIIRNCIIAENSLENPVNNDGAEIPSSVYPVTTCTNAFIAAENCEVQTNCSSDLGGTNGNTTAAPRFKNSEAADFSFGTKSPCYNGGTLLEWISAASLDLANKPRLLGIRPDIGCYECQRKQGATLIIR